MTNRLSLVTNLSATELLRSIIDCIPYAIPIVLWLPSIFLSDRIFIKNEALQSSLSKTVKGKLYERVETAQATL